MKILVIYTGGTIGMIKDSNTGLLNPGSIDGVNFFLKKEKLDDFCDVISFKKPIDSSEFNNKYYSELSTVIKDNYAIYDSFLVLMGTDTMSYVSSLLSFAITGLNKPIVFTGGQKTLYEENSDSIKNFKNAFNGLLAKIFNKEVGIYFADKWHRAVCSTKIHSYNDEAYSSNFVINKIKQTEEEFHIITNVKSNIVIVKLSPFQNENVLFNLLNDESIDGIVIEVYGIGNMPSFSKALDIRFKNEIQKGLKVVMTSQCFYGGVTIPRYASGSKYIELGFLNAKNMTKESIVCKLIVLLEKKLSNSEFKLRFEVSNRGE